jgi:tetratricopeptide (TPR) repeat protein
LSDLGQREAALAASEEAVAHYRELARTRPDAFVPDLAISLNNLADHLSALGQREAALAASEEAIIALSPHFQANPQSFGDWMAHIRAIYVKLSQECRREPRFELLGATAPAIDDEPSGQTVRAVIDVPTPHPGDDLTADARLTIEHLERLRQWRKLPFSKRLVSKPPEPPSPDLRGRKGSLAA